MKKKLLKELDKLRKESDGGPINAKSLVKFNLLAIEMHEKGIKSKDIKLRR